jgi:oligoribonuclease (3'-5' exoribonuclease)
MKRITAIVYWETIGNGDVVEVANNGSGWETITKSKAARQVADILNEHADREVALHAGDSVQTDDCTFTFEEFNVENVS